VHFLSKWYTKGKGLDLGAGPPRTKLSISPPPPTPPTYAITAVANVRAWSTYGPYPNNVSVLLDCLSLIPDKESRN